MSLASALRQILDELQLKYVIHNEVLLITSPQKAESDDFMVTKAYPVQDLLQIAADGTVDLMPLRDLLQNTVATKSWIDNGGNGTISDIVVGNRVLLGQVLCRRRRFTRSWSRRWKCSAKRVG